MSEDSNKNHNIYRLWYNKKLKEVYEVTAEKSGYIFVKEAGETSVFSAYKLGEISVKVRE
jgi:hypothetical protein